MFARKYYMQKTPYRREALKILRCFIVGTIILIIINVFLILIISNNERKVNHQQEDQQNMTIHEFFKPRENMKLSVLGDILFRLKRPPLPHVLEKVYTILVWKEGKFLERRHMNSYQALSDTDKVYAPFADCSVDNCRISYEEYDLSNADAVVFLLLRQNGFENLPNSSYRSPHQRWIFLTDENPHNAFMYKSKNNWKDYNGVFNWSMTYRMDSDIPVSYGRVVPLYSKKPAEMNHAQYIESLIPFILEKQRKVLVATYLSDCSTKNPIIPLLIEIQKIIEIDIYGKCEISNKECPSSQFADCINLNDYLFYISFESRDCKDYLTQRLFWNAYSKGAIPIILSPSRENCLEILPPNSYLHYDAFKGPTDLANHILLLNETLESSLVNMHGWRSSFLVLNEHGYFTSRSYHYCRICEALSYNDEAPKVYNDLSVFLDPQKVCSN